MGRSRPHFRYFTYVPLLVMAIPLLGAWKVCKKKVKAQEFDEITQSILMVKAGSSADTNRDTLHGRPSFPTETNVAAVSSSNRRC